jgi:hypothetical protein
MERQDFSKPEQQLVNERERGGMNCKEVEQLPEQLTP